MATATTASSKIIPAETAQPAAAPVDLSTFWQYDQPLESSLVVVTPSSSTVLDVLDNIPLPVNDARIVMAYLRDLYQSVGQQAAMKALAPTTPEDSSPG